MLVLLGLHEAMFLIFEDDFEPKKINKKKGAIQDFDVILTLLLASKVKKEREWYILPRSTHWAEICLFSSEFFSDVQFQASFRMSRTSFYTLHELLRPYIKKSSTQFREPIPSERRLAIFLYHITLGATYLAISNQFACGKSTVCGIILDITEAILHHLTKRYIRFSTTEEAMRSIEFWRAKSRIPGVVACLDGCHIQIIRPSKSGTAYFNRKGFYSINVQGTHSHECII